MKPVHCVECVDSVATFADDLVFGPGALFILVDEKVEDGPLAERLLAFGEHYRQIARPFEWTFTREDLDALLARIEHHEPQLTLTA
jgi:hypothetical protein